MTERLRMSDDNRRWWTLAAMCFALFMVMLDNTVVNVALPSIQADFGSSLSALEWTINAYTLPFAVLLVTGGRLGDLFGRRRVFLCGVVLFALASATIGLAPTDGWLIASRAVQGVGAALMMPGSLSILTNAFPPAERGKAIGTWAGVSALALAVGPLVGGWLTEEVSWRAIFLLNLPVAAGAVAMTLFAADESRDETAERKLDIPGIGALTVALTALVLALVEGNSWGWDSAGVLGLLALAVGSGVAFVVIEKRARVPIVDFAFFRSRTFVGANIVAFTVSFAMFAMFFFIALYMQNILGYSPLEAGVRFLPSTLVIMVAGPIAGRLADRIGARPLMVAGLLTTSVALFWQSRIDEGSGYGTLWPGFVLMGLGMGLDHVADEHGGDERRRPQQGGRRLRDALHVPHGRRDLRRGRPRRAGRRRRPQRPRAGAAAAHRPRAGPRGRGARLRGRARGRAAGARERRPCRVRRRALAGADGGVRRHARGRRGRLVPDRAEAGRPGAAASRARAGARGARGGRRLSVSAAGPA